MLNIEKVVKDGLSAAERVWNTPMTPRSLVTTVARGAGFVGLGELERIGRPYMDSLARYMRGYDGDGWHDPDLFTNVVNNGENDWVFTGEESALLNQRNYVNYWADQHRVTMGAKPEDSECYVAMRDLSQETTWYYDWHKGDSGLNEYDWWEQQDYRMDPNEPWMGGNLPSEKLHDLVHDVNVACKPDGVLDEMQNVWDYDRSHQDRLDGVYGVDATSFVEWASHIGPMLASGLAIWGMSQVVDRTLQAGSPWIGRLGVDVWEGTRKEVKGTKRIVRELADYALAITAYSLIRGALG
ncbi:MAG: hypothetical protein AUJ56_05445 [Zetaproteobacteria bacterium CG1_02_49_23]|nr:MAG: hypothetical protein AUJ56_05445 [Zetaproteobacteria bacterium CG1_02_49_23]